MSVVARAAEALDRLGAARLAPARGPLVVMYHGLGGDDGVAPAAFEAQLDLLRARRRVVPLGEAVALLGRAEAAEVAAVSFDDGYVDFASEAVPRLAARALHATVFVPAGHVGGSNVWDAGHAPVRKLMDAAALAALDPRVASVGAHGYSHVRMRGLAADALARETHEARSRLEDACGRTVDLFAYPYGQLGDFDAVARRAVEEAGFRAACSTHFGRGSTPGERFALRRVGVEPGDSLDAFRRKLDGAYDFVAWKERLGARVRRLRGTSA